MFHWLRNCGYSVALWLCRISQQYYMQVSAWMIRMEADFTTPLEIVKKEITNRAYR